MGNKATGNQVLSYSYDNEATTSAFNKHFADVIKTGIYQGGLLTNPSGNDIEIAPFIGLFYCSSGELVRIQTSEVITITVSEANPLIVGNLAWVDSTDNGADFSATANGSLFTNDIIFGEAIYTTGSISSISYAKKTRGSFDTSANMYVDNNLNVRENIICENDIYINTNEKATTDKQSIAYALIFG